MLDHIGFPVADLEKSMAFYDQVLPAIGASRLALVTAEMTGADAHAGYGTDHPSFWISSGQPMRGCLHVAFSAASRAQVDAFYRVALAAGARDNGPPGIRAHYHPHYYGAFVLDPDGHNIEAVCHRPES
ncbi:VOC family protein [Niveispirillum sp. BGYR6]|uniref:VOC family protein n=1 Tax=Niveispirillum sp. BGYR6 TaxID=2971249 RepID=UPI0022B969B4|nr:VOC family protein [Niveispirillum sp. BGYR6]MDG5494967.1 VOC family protein [Niveispirillum sp. BGYR6]